MNIKKTCSCCQKSKSRTSFGSNALAPDGLAWYCKDCANEKQRAWKHKNAKKVKKWRLEYKRKSKTTARA